MPKLPPRPKLTKLSRRRQSADERAEAAFKNVPRITNETVAEHREDVLRGARKYIYPLRHSRQRALAISSTIFVTAIIIFFAYCGLALYKFQSNSGFIYGVSQVIPFPIAKAGPSWVSYNSYLFELKHYMHYYSSQQGVNFNTASGKAQLANFKKQALQQVINDAYTKQLAKQHHLSISNQQVNNEVTQLQRQNRLGSSQRELDEVLNEYWGWTEADFKHSLQQQLLNQTVVDHLDTSTHTKAEAALKLLQAGTPFATVATQQSDDAITKANGGQYPAPISTTDSNLAAPVVAQIARLPINQVSEIIDTGYSLEIVMVTSRQADKSTASHIEFDLQPLGNFVAPLQKAHPAHRYIKV